MSWVHPRCSPGALCLGAARRGGQCYTWFLPPRYRPKKGKKDLLTVDLLLGAAAVIVKTVLGGSQILYTKLFRPNSDLSQVVRVFILNLSSPYSSYANEPYSSLLQSCQIFLIEVFFFLYFSVAY